MSLIDTHTTGQIAAAIAVTALVSIITLSIMYAGMPIFGPINDFTNAMWMISPTCATFPARSIS